MVISLRLGKSRTGLWLRIVLAMSLAVGSMSAIAPANAGLFDCVKAKKWSNYSKLRTAYLKDPNLKTQEDWFRSYVFATIFTGYPKCFNSKDVKVMRKYADALTQTCIRNPNWNFACTMIRGRGALADWAYESYK
jgi:hypothetical protein